MSHLLLGLSAAALALFVTGIVTAHAATRSGDRATATWIRRRADLGISACLLAQATALILDMDGLAVGTLGAVAIQVALAVAALAVWWHEHHRTTPTAREGAGVDHP
jgi:hypothetical protein